MPRRAGPDDEMTDRMCAVTREVRPIEDLIRFVVDPAGAVTPDIRRKLPGRGVSVTATLSAVNQAVKRKVFARHFKVPVTVAPDLADITADLLRRDALQALSFANKAGAAVSGFGKAEEALMSGKARAVLHASEAQPDGRRKLGQIVRRVVEAGARQPHIIDSFAEAELDMAFGRGHVIHGAIIAGPAGDNACARWLRYDRFSQTPTPSEGLPHAPIALPADAGAGAVEDGHAALPDA